jgi:hypothetical protein
VQQDPGWALPHGECYQTKLHIKRCQAKSLKPYWRPTLAGRGNRILAGLCLMVSVTNQTSHTRLPSQISQIILEANFGWQVCNRILVRLCLMVSVTKPNFTYKDDKPEISNHTRGQLWLAGVKQDPGGALPHGECYQTKLHL